MDDLKAIRLSTDTGPSTRPAILRKDFVTRRDEIYEAYAYGADTILLIVAVLPSDTLKDLIEYARGLGMEPLVEVHADAELAVALEAGARVLGVNNRNLHTFEMFPDRTSEVCKALRGRGLKFGPGAGLHVCSLSGFSDAAGCRRARSDGCSMVLIGESLMRSVDPVKAVEGLDLRGLKTGGAEDNGVLVKVCGVRSGEDARLACEAGADLVGTVWVEGRKRCVTKDEGRNIVAAVRAFGERKRRLDVGVLPSGGSGPPLVVGVFQDQSVDYINSIVEEVGESGGLRS